MPTIDLIDHVSCSLNQGIEDITAMLETASRLYNADGVLLYSIICTLLSEDVQQLHVSWAGADAMDDGERIFAFGDIVANAFAAGVYIALEILIVITDLENYPHEIH